MNMPGFAAEAALYPAGGCHRTVGDHAVPVSERVVPAMRRSSFTLCGPDPDNICIYRCCTISIYGEPTRATASCSHSDICHPK